MKNALRALLLFLALSPLLTGCRTMAAKHAPQSQVAAAFSGQQSDRVLIWSANLNITVSNLPAAREQVAAVTARHKGLIESQSESSESSADYILRIPVTAFPAAVEELAGLGDVKYRNVSGEDVTAQYVDLQARLKSKQELRQRYTALLDKATEVKDLLAIETELNRVQTEIEQIEAQLKMMNGQIEYSVVRLSLSRAPIRGPLGLVFHGIGWVIEKLFVIRD
jgi:hypothetical protein